MMVTKKGEKNMFNPNGLLSNCSNSRDHPKIITYGRSDEVNFEERSGEMIN